VNKYETIQLQVEKMNKYDMLDKFRDLDKVFRDGELSDDELDSIDMELSILEDYLLLTDIPLEEIYKR
jgi:hypothetical protein